MRSDGSNVKRITFGKGLYGTPVWSPRGDLIAFTKVHKGKFYIGVMRTDGKEGEDITENLKTIKDIPKIINANTFPSEIEKRRESLKKQKETMSEKVGGKM